MNIRPTRSFALPVSAAALLAIACSRPTGDTPDSREGAAIPDSLKRLVHNMPHVIGGAWTAVFANRGGRWAIVQEHFSDASSQM
jgi:hypothetical protein